MTARLPDLDEAKALDHLYETARELRDLPVFMRTDAVTILVIEARVGPGGTNIDEEKVFEAAGMTAREYWRRVLGEQCLPEDFARRVSCFMADPADTGITGDVWPVVSGNELPWYSWARKPGYRRRPLYRRRRKSTRPIRRPSPVSGHRTMGTIEERIRSALREAYRTNASFFIKTRETGVAAPEIDAATENFYQRFPTVRRVHIGQPPPPHVPARWEIRWEEATEWLVEFDPELPLPASLRHALIEDRAPPPASAEEPLAPGSTAVDPLAATGEPLGLLAALFTDTDSFSAAIVKPQVDTDQAYIAHRDDFLRKYSRYPSRQDDFVWGRTHTPKVIRDRIPELREKHLPDDVRNGGRTKNLSDKPVEK